MGWETWGCRADVADPDYIAGESAVDDSSERIDNKKARGILDLYKSVAFAFFALSCFIAVADACRIHNNT